MTLLFDSPTTGELYEMEINAILITPRKIPMLLMYIP